MAALIYDCNTGMMFLQTTAAAVPIHIRRVLERDVFQWLFNPYLLTIVTESRGKTAARMCKQKMT